MGTLRRKSLLPLPDRWGLDLLVMKLLPENLCGSLNLWTRLFKCWTDKQWIGVMGVWWPVPPVFSALYWRERCPIKKQSHYQGCHWPVTLADCRREVDKGEMSKGNAIVLAPYSYETLPAGLLYGNRCLNRELQAPRLSGWCLSWALNILPHFKAIFLSCSGSEHLGYQGKFTLTLLSILTWL